MTTQYWMLVLALALLNCRTGHLFPTATRVEGSSFEQLNTTIIELRKSNCAQEDAKFYSPTGSECIAGALECYKKVLIVVRAACFAPDTEEVKLLNKTIGLIGFTQRLKKKTLQPAEQCCKTCCEGSKKEGYQTFLQNILELYRALNSRQK